MAATTKKHRRVFLIFKFIEHANFYRFKYFLYPTVNPHYYLCFNLYHHSQYVPDSITSSFSVYNIATFPCHHLSSLTFRNNKNLNINTEVFTITNDIRSNFRVVPIRAYFAHIVSFSVNTDIPFLSPCRPP